MREVNGMRVVDRLLREHGMIAPDEVWVHGMWTPGKWVQCVRARLGGKKLVRMTHGSLSPIYLERKNKWLKRLVKPIERFLFAIGDRMACTGPWEVAWARRWGYKGPIQVIDLKRFFTFDWAGCRRKLDEIAARTEGEPLKVLYLGRQHPLKGVQCLERAVGGLNVELKRVSGHFDEALEADWKWADVLCLPTLSENFGLVVAEALARGLPVVTTDGAPAWSPESLGHPSEGLLYLEGYRGASPAQRVALLRDALGSILRRETGAGAR